MLMSADYMVYAVIIAAITVVTTYCWPQKYPSAKFPLVNQKAMYDLFNLGARKNYVMNAPRILLEGIKKVMAVLFFLFSFFGGPCLGTRTLICNTQAGNTKPFRVLTEKDEMVILPWTMAHEIRNNPDLGFNPFIAKVSISMSYNLVKVPDKLTPRFLPTI
jgi:hypothetical protein